MSDSLVSSVVRQSGVIDDLRRQEHPGAAVTLTRTATLAITTAGTLITWQAATRANGFVFSGASSDVTIPTAGYYNLSFVFTLNVNIVPLISLRVNTVTVSLFAYPYTGFNKFTAVIQRYFSTGDVIAILIVPNVNANITVIAEGVANESPILHIVQLTGSQT